MVFLLPRSILGLIGVNMAKENKSTPLERNPRVFLKWHVEYTDKHGVLHRHIVEAVNETEALKKAKALFPDS